LTALQKGLVLGALQVALVVSLGVKLTWDRSRFPRAWAKAGTYDPDLPIRGRYLGLRLEVLCEGPEPTYPTPSGAPRPGMMSSGWARGTLRAENGRLASNCSSSPQGVDLFRRQRAGQFTTTLSEPVLFFLPEHAPDPWQQAKGGELWAEVTVPKNGPPRPIRLAVKRGDMFTPLEIK
jgi:hypothetical protein